MGLEKFQPLQHPRPTAAKLSGAVLRSARAVRGTVIRAYGVSALRQFLDTAVFEDFGSHVRPLDG